MATVLCDCGTSWLTRLMNATEAATTYFVGWGEGTGTVSKGQFVVNSPVQARETAVTSISAFNQEQWTATLTATAVRSITQAALFSNNSGAPIVVGDFTTLALALNDRISFTVTLTTT